MKVLITGGAGFIGSNLANRLSSLGNNITVFDNLSSGTKDYLCEKNISFVEGNILDFDRLTSVMCGHDAVIHLAAQGNVLESINGTRLNFDTNVLGTLNCLEAAKNNNVKKFIFSSTGGALMGNTPPPVDEKSVPKPISPYGASKLAAEGYCSAFSASFGFDIVILRFANVYGPNSLHKVGVINKFFEALKKNQQLQLFGKCTRDFIFIDDLIFGIELALAADLEGCNTFHLATNQPTTVTELAQKIARAMGIDEFKFEQLPSRIGEVKTTFAASDLAEKVLDFRCQTELDVGIQKTVNWLDSKWT